MHKLPMIKSKSLNDPKLASGKPPVKKREYSNSTERIMESSLKHNFIRNSSIHKNMRVNSGMRKPKSNHEQIAMSYVKNNSKVLESNSVGLTLQISKTPHVKDAVLAQKETRKSELYVWVQWPSPQYYIGHVLVEISSTKHFLCCSKNSWVIL